MSPEALADALAADLKLTSSERYELISAARKLATLDDAQVRTEAAALAERHRSTSTLAGAFLVLSAGIAEERLGASMSEDDRVAHEESLTGIGTVGGAADSARIEDPDLVEALARAADLDGAGDGATAARIRAAVESHQRGG